ncbi:MAG: Clp protease N-terminal domain-containing protein [Planctomycetes bacterium]|nr:Clp protease N-terminal domain-containing protein [Planctomycetota bacterium]
MHLLIGVLADPAMRATHCLERLGAEVEVLVARAWALLEGRAAEFDAPREGSSPSGPETEAAKGEHEPADWASRGLRVLELSERVASELGHREVGSDHLLLASFRAGGDAAELLVELGVEDDALVRALLDERRARLEAEAVRALEPMVRVLRDASVVCERAGSPELAAELRALLAGLERPR